MQTKKIIQFSLLGAIFLTCILFFFLKYKDRQNGYYGTFTLNIEKESIKADTDDYVLHMNSENPISVGIDIAGISTQNIEKVLRFYANPYSQEIIDSNEMTYLDGPQYFAIPRSGGEYLVGATIYYRDGKTIKSTDIFDQTMITIRPKKDNQPIASLKINKEKITLNEEVTFEVITKIHDESKKDDFETNKKILRDFDGDGSRDRTTTNNDTKYRYTQSHGILKYTPKVAVQYDGLTGSNQGATIYIK